MGFVASMTIPAIRDALTRIDEAAHRRSVALVLEAKRKSNTLYFIGNGGSAAIASHMAADFMKNGQMKAMCFNDGPLVTCIANDHGYGDVFARPLQRFARSEDILFAISSSGESANILEAVGIAKMHNMDVITLSGFSPDNRLRQQGDVNFWVDSDRYGVVEVTHHAIVHSILDAVMARPDTVKSQPERYAPVYPAYEDMWTREFVYVPY